MTDETEAGRAVLGGGAACSFRLWGSSLSIESRQWELSAVLDGETGAVVACGPSWQEAYPDAAVVSLNCQAQGGRLTLQGQKQTYTGTYQQAERSQKDTVYQVTVEGSAGQAVCSTTDHRTGEQLPPWCSPSRRRTLCISPANKEA